MHQAPGPNLALALALVLLPAPAAAAADEKPFRPDWLARDVAMARDLRALLSEPPAGRQELAEKLGASRVDLDRDAGFGGRQQKLVRFGGYTSVWIKVTAFRGDVADLTVFQDCPKERKPRQWAALAPIWGDLAAAGADGFRFELRRERVLDRYAAAIEAALGATPALAPARDPEPHLRTLRSPREFYDWGTVCYDAGVAPAGRAATEALLAAGDPGPFRSALRGFNPEGRVYAAEALLRLERSGSELSAADRSAIAIIRALDVPIGTCSGCAVIMRTAAEALATWEEK